MNTDKVCDGKRKEHQRQLSLMLNEQAKERLEKLAQTEEAQEKAKLDEWPPLVIEPQEVELVHIQCVHPKNFDLVFVFEDYTKQVIMITDIPKEMLESVKDWVDSNDIRYSEGTQSLDWSQIMPTIVKDIERFFKDGGWSFLEPESDEGNTTQGSQSSEKRKEHQRQLSLTLNEKAKQRLLRNPQTKDAEENAVQDEWPTLDISLQDVEFVHFERVHVEKFNLAFVFKDYTRDVVLINDLPNNMLESIKDWVDSRDIRYSEGSHSLDWGKIMPMIVKDVERFFKDGGWSFLDPESDEEEKE